MTTPREGDDLDARADAILAAWEQMPAELAAAVSGTLTMTGSDSPLFHLGHILSYEVSWLTRLQLRCWILLHRRDKELISQLRRADESPWPQVRRALMVRSLRSAS